MVARRKAQGKAARRRIPLATRAIEQLLCDPQPFGDIERAYPRVADAWSLQMPDLTSLPRATGARRPTRFCIATEDIVGPVRNGGIGTTYAALATMLATHGHDVTILYLKGEEVENETISHWIDFYAGIGVKFVPVANYAQSENIITTADQWMRPIYDMYRWLLDNPMDVVHVSEWRGSGFMCLTAKRQGIAFADTLFIVKTSSPWLWNRLYGSYSIDRLGDLAKTFAERRSVELADMVIGGSLHLLRWMASQGYVLPKDRTFVQPNVVSFAHLQDLVKRRNLRPGRRMPIDEFVFFGRLEARKGLLTFCHSVRRLMKLGHKLPARISFVGKPGARLAVRPNQTVIDYIEEETADWPTEVSVLTDFQQKEAISYLLDGARLAVMPSTIENSSLAVYEAAICQIPFIASDAGGTSELLVEKDHKHVLCDAHPIPLAAKLAEALDKGGYIATPSFDNEHNIEVWKAFNESLCRGLRETLLKRAAGRPRARAKARAASVDVAIFSRGDRRDLEQTLDALKAQQQHPHRVLIAVDAIDEAAASKMAKAAAKKRRLDCDVLSTLDYDPGYALNEAAHLARGDYIVFLHAGATLKPQALRVLTEVAERRSADILTWHHRIMAAGETASNEDRLVAEMIGSPSETLYLEGPRDLPLFVRRRAFEQLKGFTVDFRVPLHERELISKGIVAGLRCETVPMELGAVADRDAAWIEKECFDVDAGEFRILRPYLAALPLAMREAVLAGIGLQRRMPKRAKKVTANKKTMPEHTGWKPVPVHRSGYVAETGISLAPGKANDRDVLVHLTGELAAKTPWRFPRMDRKARIQPGAAGWAVNKLVETIRDDPTRSGSLPRHLQLFSGWSGPDAKDGERYNGRVLDVAEGAVIGWIADRENPGTPVTVEVHVNGRRISSVPANMELPSVYQLSELASGHGFRIPLFNPLLSRLRRSAKAVEIDVFTKGGVALARGLRAYRPKQPIRNSGFEGFLDTITDATLRGWVWMPTQPERHFEVTIYLDGRFYTRVRADVIRTDLSDHGIAGGDYSFSLRIPERFRGNEQHQVDVFIADTGIRLQGSPLIINRRGHSHEFMG